MFETRHTISRSHLIHLILEPRVVRLPLRERKPETVSPSPFPDGFLDLDGPMLHGLDIASNLPCVSTVSHSVTRAQIEEEERVD